MRLTDITLTAPDADQDMRVRMDRESRTITALYERCLEGQVARGWKILVACVPSVRKPGVALTLGVLEVEVEADVEEVLALDARERKQAMLDILHRGVLAVAAEEGLPPAPFERARQCVLGKDFVNEWGWPRKKWNPSRTLRGELWCAQEIDGFRAWLVVEDKGGAEVARRQVIDTRAREFAWAHLLGRTRWTGPRRLALFARDGTEVGAVEVP